MIVLGFSGRSGSGKNYIAELIKARYQGVEILAFADPLKKVAAELFNFPYEWTLTQEGKKTETWYKWEWIVEGKSGYMTVRDILQYVGTEVVRNTLSNQHWIRLLEEKIIKNRENGTNLVCITDVRFLNEAALIHKYGLNIRVIGRDGGLCESHVSEACLKTWNAGTTISNNLESDDALLEQLTILDSLRAWRIS